MASVIPTMGSKQMKLRLSGADRRGRIARRASARRSRSTGSSGPTATSICCDLAFHRHHRAAVGVPHEIAEHMVEVVVLQRRAPADRERTVRSAVSRRSGPCSAPAASACSRPPRSSTRRAANRSAESTDGSRSTSASARCSCSRSWSSTSSTPSCRRYVISIVCANGNCFIHGGCGRTRAGSSPTRLSRPRWPRRPATGRSA